MYDAIVVGACIGVLMRSRKSASSYALRSVSGD